MISIIISSAKKALLTQVSKNIADTISVPYEIIGIDNSDGARGLCAVYNQGINQAKYDILCFAHEDISFATVGWGKIVKDIFDTNTDLGLLGVAGGGYKSLSPSGWNGYGGPAERSNLIQDFKFTDKKSYHHYCNPKNEKLAPVACIDGVFMCTTKTIALKTRFDEWFTGFHVYDIDFSLQVGAAYKVAVTYDIMIHHFSEGNHNSLWAADTLKLHKKWGDTLPVNVTGLSKKEAINFERQTFKYFADMLIKFNMPLGSLNRYLWHKNRYVKMSLPLFFKLQYHLVVKWIKQKLS